MTKVISIPENYDQIRIGIVKLLNSARAASARTVNAVMTATYWEIGRRIVNSEQRGGARADYYGEQLVEQLARDLSKQFGRGFGKINLWRMRAFYRVWSEKKILSTPSKESVKPNLPRSSHKLPNWHSYALLTNRVPDRTASIAGSRSPSACVLKT